jgi:adenylosuccinate lyase
LRREGFAEPYELLKEFSRGRALTTDDLHRFIASLPVSDAVRAELQALTPATYIGLAVKLAQLRDEATVGNWT